MSSFEILSSYVAVLVVTFWLSYQYSYRLLVAIFGRRYRIKIIADEEEKIFRVRARSRDAAITKVRKISIEGKDQCQS